MEQAVFQLRGFLFDKAALNLRPLSVDDVLKLNFIPSGVLHENKGEFNLVFEFFATTEKEPNKEPLAYVKCSSQFVFKSPIKKDQLPDYFYANSIAILFPYVRSFVSTLTLQAGMIPPIILPTLNLSSLQKDLEANVKVENK